jgi:hypothetical protein
MAKKYEFRKLNSRDLFMIIKLLKKIGLDNFSKVLEKGNIKEIVDKFTDKDTKTTTTKTLKKAKNKETEYYQVGLAIGLEAGQVVIERLNECEDEIFEILSKTSNLEMKDLEEMPIDEFIEMIFDFVKLEDFQKLFQKAVSLLKSEN